MNKTKDGYKLLDAGQRLVPEPNQAFDPDKIDTHHWVMAIKELLKQQNLNPKKIKLIATGISGASASVKQITTMEMPAEELESAMTFEARKHIPMDGTDAVIDYQILGSNEKEWVRDEIDNMPFRENLNESNFEDYLDDIEKRMYVDRRGGGKVIIHPFDKPDVRSP